MIESLKPSYEPGQIDKESPEKIYLQIDVNQIREDRDQPWPGSNGVTWCAESVQGLEVEYIRADLLADLLLDADRYRWLRDSYQNSDYLFVDPGMNSWNDELGMTVEASLDELVDTAMALDREG